MLTSRYPLGNVSLFLGDILHSTHIKVGTVASWREQWHVIRAARCAVHSPTGASAFIEKNLVTKQVQLVFLHRGFIPPHDPALKIRLLLQAQALWVEGTLR